MIVCGFGFPGLMWVLFNAAMLWWFWALCLSVVGCLFGDWLFIVGLGWLVSGCGVVVGVVSWAIQWLF